MATYEKDVLLQKKLSNGNNQRLYPITKLQNVIDDDANSLDEILLNIVSAITTEDGSYLITEDGYYLITGL